jgi:low temperature requirement protein LtrA
MSFGAQTRLLRTRKEHEHNKVDFVELFFDLVFVFAITQLSHSLLAHMTIEGAVQTTLLLMAVWWVWIFTAWVTNWLEPHNPPVRLMLFALMLAGLVLSTSLPKAFGERAIPFALAYVFMQVGRSLFTLWALRQHDTANFRNFQRISVWLILAGCFWIGGAFQEGNTRLALWLLALGIEYVSPSLGFWTPGLGRSTTEEWEVEGGHLSERCGLFIIIALGESILVTGATFANLTWTTPTLIAFISSFVGSVTMWWIYFNRGAETGSEKIAATTDPGRLARVAYTYIHLLLVAGIIVVAVADELVLAHPLGHTAPKALIAIVGGPALYLLGNILFKRAVAGVFAVSHVVGLLLLAALVPFSHSLAPLHCSIATTLILILVAVLETTSKASAEDEKATIHC